MLTLIIWLVVVLAAVGIVWWMLNSIPIPPPMRPIVNIVIGVLALIILFAVASKLLGPSPISLR